MKTLTQTNLLSPHVQAMPRYSIKALIAIFFAIASALSASASTDTWTNDASGVWSASVNWLGGAGAPGGVDAIADFSTINITADRTVTLDVPRTYGVFNFGDASGTQNWLLDATGGSLMTLGVSSGSPTFNVTNVATVTAPLAGTAGLTKAGPGTLVLGGTNSYSGNTIVTNGSLKLTNTVSTGPLLYMSFDNVSGSVVKNDGSLGAVADGLVVGTNVSIVAGGRYGNGLQVGSGAVTTGGILIDHVVTLLNNTNNTSANAWTVAMWVKTTTTTNGGLLYQGGNTWASGNTRFYTAGNVNDTGGPYFGGVRNSQGWEVGQIPINDGNWHFCAMTMFSPGNVKKIYVDGVLDAFSATANNNLWTNNATGNQVWIGGAPNVSDNNQGLNGLIDEVYIYNRALSQVEISNVMATSSTPAPQVILPATPVSVASGAKLDLNGVSSTVTGLSGAGFVDNVLTNGTVLIQPTFAVNNSSDATYTGFITNSGGVLSLVKSGAGALTLSNLNGFSGNAYLNSGTLNINHASAIGTAGTLVINGGTIDTTAGSPVTVVNNKASIWAGDFTFTGTTNLSFGTGGVTLAGPGTGRTITVSGSNILTVGAVNGTFGPGYDLIKNGTGTLLLNANSTVGGRTLAVNAGTLSLNGDLNNCANLSGTGTIQTSGTGVNKWFFINNPGNVVFSGTLQNFPGTTGRGLGFNKAGLGTVTLNGNCTFNDTITVQQGRLNMTGSGISIIHNVAAEAASAVGTVAGTSGVLTISNGATVTIGSAGVNPYTTGINIGSTATAFGDIVVDNSTMVVSNQLGVGTASYGAYSQKSGLTRVGGFIACGASTNGGVINLAGGTLVQGIGPWTGHGVTLGYGGVNAGTHGLMNVYNNAAYLLGGTSVGIWPGEVNNGTFSMWGNPTVTVTNDGIQLGRGNAAGNGVLNLNGGTLSVNFVRTGPGVGTFNFNGGTLKANAQASGGFIQGTVTPTLIDYSGGAIIDDGGYALDITAPIQAATGYGVASIPVTSGGSNYIDTPLVLISGGSGTGAKAASQVNDSGAVTNIVITCPGNNYSSGDSLTLTVVGGGGSGLVLGTPTFAPNVSGGLTKLGAGTLTLSGGYSFTNAIKVSSGTLAVNTASGFPSSAGDVIVSNSAVLAVSFSGGIPMPVNNLTLGTNAALTIDFGTLTGGNPTVAVITNAGGLFAPGTNIVINLAGFGLKTNATAIVLIDYAGAALSGADFAHFSIGSLPPGVAGYLVNNTANSSLDFAITNAGQNLYWRGVDDATSSSDNNWNINTTTNWYSVGDNLPAVYMQYTNGASIVGDPVLFDDNLQNNQTNVNLAATIRPFTVKVDSSYPYSIAGAGSITGVGSVTKTNSGSLFLGTSNNYTGGTFVYQGTVIVTNNSGLGASSGSVTLGGGTLQFNGNAAGARLVSVPGNSSIGVITNATSTLSNVVSGSGVLTKIDNGTLTFLGTNTYTGSTVLKAGTLVIAGGTTGTTNADIQMSPDSTDTGVLTVSGGTLFANRVILGGNSANNSAANVAVVNQTGGTIQSRQWFTVGSGVNNVSTAGNGTFNMSGGTLNCHAQQMEVGNFTDTVGTVNLTNGNINIWNNNFLSMGANNNCASATINQLGGAITFYSDAGVTPGGTGIFYIGRAGTLAGTFTNNLNGGTLNANQIQRNTANTATAVFNFNGGVLRALRANTTFMFGLTAANVLGGGAIIDASTNAITISQALVDGGGGGGLTKRGTATLILTGTNTYSGTTLVSTGALFVTTAHQSPGPVTIVSNATFGVISDSATTVTVGSLNMWTNSTLQFTMGSGTNPITRMLQCGTLTRLGTNQIRLAGIISPGVFPLVQYTGALAGSGVILSNALTPHGMVATISNDVTTSTLYAIVSGTPGVVWQGYSTIAGRTNLWDLNTTTNWLAAGSPSDYAEVTPPGDSVTFDDSGSGLVLLSNTVSPATLLISNNAKAYTFTGSGRIAGTTGITKLGTGTATLTFTNANTYTGNVIVSNGTLQLGSAVNIPDGAGNGNVTIGSAGTLDINAFAETINGLTGSGTINNSGGATAILTTGGADRDVNWNGTITNTGAGGVTLFKVGIGTMTLGGTNYLLGQSQINGGSNVLNSTAQVNVLGTGEFVIGYSTTASLTNNGGTLIVPSWLVVGRTIAAANGTLVVNSGTVQKSGINNLVVGSVGATGRLEVNGGQVLNNGMLWLGENATANGLLQLNGGLIQATQVRPQGATPVTSAANFNGGIMQASASSDDFFGTNATGARTMLVMQSGGLYFDTQAFNVTNQSDLIDDGSATGGLVKLGSGLLAITSTGNNYNGLTIVSNGTLNIHGSIPGAVTVKSGATLGGNGTIGGTVTVQAGGKLGAGASIGTLTLSASPVLNGSVVAEIDRNGGSPLADLINLPGSGVTYGGSLVVSNIGASLVAGDSFTLFSATSHSGAFSSIVGSPGTGLAYSFTNGILSVISASTVATNAPTLTNSVSGGVLTLSWPTDHLGWMLQKQTNSRALGLRTNWFDVTGSDSMTSTNITIDKNDPTVFYRLRYTLP